MQREIAERLRDIAPPGSFAVQRSAPAEALRIDVAGVGPLDLPLSPRTVPRVRAVAKRSRYGMRDRTVYDVRVRNSWEIARRRIRIDQHRWNATLIPLLDEIRAGLGLAEEVVLKAELHNMLLYERGQFFVSHQDSEKSDGMIGTLVVTLPSAFRGGEMTVEQHGEVMAFRGSRTALHLIAFYADCRHEVRPVTSGARVVLTYNLLTKGVAATMPPRVEPRMLDALMAALQRHFDTPLAGRFGGEAAPPDRFVYLLDHEYTARGLHWDLLKGATRRGQRRCGRRPNGSTARSFSRRPMCTRRGNATLIPRSGIHIAAGPIGIPGMTSKTTMTQTAVQMTRSRFSLISSTATSSCETGSHRGRRKRPQSRRRFATKSSVSPVRRRK